MKYMYLALALVLASCTTNQSSADAYDPSGGFLTIRFLNVGQGDSILITSPEGKTAVYDGGRSPKIIEANIAKYNLKNLDVMIASHADFDHINGLYAFADLKPKYFINNGIASDTVSYRRLIAKLKDLNVQGIVASDRKIKLGSTTLHILNLPPKTTQSEEDDQNLNSVGVIVEQGKFKAFLDGDAEPKTMEAWLSEYSGELQNIDVYKAAHHGSKHNDNETFLKAISPSLVVVSVGENSYGHPTAEALNLYQKYAKTIYRTDLDGTVTIKVDLKGYYRSSTEQ